MEHSPDQMIESHKYYKITEQSSELFKPCHIGIIYTITGLSLNSSFDLDIYLGEKKLTQNHDYIYTNIEVDRNRNRIIYISFLDINLKNKFVYVNSPHSLSKYVHLLKAGEIKEKLIKFNAVLDKELQEYINKFQTNNFDVFVFNKTEE